MSKLGVNQRRSKDNVFGKGVFLARLEISLASPAKSLTPTKTNYSTNNEFFTKFIYFFTTTTEMYDTNDDII